MLNYENKTDSVNKTAEPYMVYSSSSHDKSQQWETMAEEMGTRPCVSRYSLARYSPREWEAHNQTIMSSTIINDTNYLQYDIKFAMLDAIYNTDKLQTRTWDNLKQRAKEIYRWQVEVQKSCQALSEEVQLLEGERRRLKEISLKMIMTESISQECFDLRAKRNGKDLVRDIVETELIKERELIAILRLEFNKILRQVEEQQIRNKAAKQSIEHDFMNKEKAHDTDVNNLELNSKSNTITFCFGAAKFPEMSAATLQHWLYYSKKNVENNEAVRQQSLQLRKGIERRILAAARLLHAQADQTDLCFARSIEKLNQLLIKQVTVLRDTIKTLAEDEKLIEDLKESIWKLDAAMKLAQTSLNNRNLGLNDGERVRDKVHTGLLEEVKYINRAATGLRMKLKTLEHNWVQLRDNRLELETAIAQKKKYLHIDRDRCAKVRLHFASSYELAGYITQQCNLHTFR